MKPYYESGGITIYHGDCREILPTVGFFDLLLTDPPYGLSWGGVGFQNQPLLNHREVASWDKRPAPEVIQLVMSVCKHHIVWGGNYLADMLGPCKGPLVWNKKTGANTFADGEMAWSDVVGTMRIFTHQWCGAFKDSERGVRSVHPTQKPVELMRWCIGLTKNVRTILDPFGGSGTTGCAAKLLGRSAVLIEIEERYCEIAARRVEKTLGATPDGLLGMIDD